MVHKSATLKVKYNAAQNKTQTTLGVWVDELKVKLLVGKKDDSKPSDDVTLALEKPGHFILEHHLQKKVSGGTMASSIVSCLREEGCAMPQAPPS